jgi:hypothetical protein
MKTFRWITLRSFTDGELLTLFDVSREKEFIVVAHGNVVHDGKEYKPVVHSNGGTFTTIESMSLQDAMEAVEKKLMDDGIIEDGDVVESK